MYRDVTDGKDVRITEKSEKARKEFFDKCEEIKKGAKYNHKLILDIANRSALEYNKVFGRIGVHPLLHLKGGKKKPRYLIDREELWVMYKPALWQMGGTDTRWRQNVQKVHKETKSRGEAEELYINSERNEVLQEWHGLQAGLAWLPSEKANNDMKGWGFIQRLDVETDGPVMICKSWRAMRCMQVQMKLHVNTKAYMCLVHGRVENKTQHIKRKFAELGSDHETQVMLQHDAVNDPFFDWSKNEVWTDRSVRMAETFFKPLAYFHRKEDNSDYTLVYVNILTGITHQIRITMQSCGHPLVSDDRYLPREQALLDLKWCPRNFLVCVRSDLFDLTGPHKNAERQRYTRVPIENPLPEFFQKVLTNRLTLVEQLDPLADLFVGPQYWAIGDQELMNAHPKDSEYRKKVMRWGQRRGIHNDALCRLLLLAKDEVDDILNRYRPPSEMGAEKFTFWVCPVCMHWNTPEKFGKQNIDVDPDACDGGGKITALGKHCLGRRQVDEDTKMPEGWYNYAKDPTIHLMYMINPKWLDARRNVFKHARPAWETPPHEPDATEADEEIVSILVKELQERALKGESGIHESELSSIAGLEAIKLPLGGLAPECLAQATRLPGNGSFSPWYYTLKGHRRIRYTQNFDIRTARLKGPLFVKTEPLPIAQHKPKASPPPPEGSPTDSDVKRPADSSPDSAPSEKKPRTDSVWVRRDSKSNPGKYYWVHSETGETSLEPPAGTKGELPVWERLKSKSSGKAYYFNHATGETSVERPPNIKIRNEIKEATPEHGGKWERREAASKPGQFYYYNTGTGENVVRPPDVDLPWSWCESKTKKGQFFYHNELTGETSVDPPPQAKAAPDKKPGAGSSAAGKGKLPSGWTKTESDKYKNKFYYVNSKTGETSWKPPSPWERMESVSKPGQYYYKNCETGETSWEKKPVGISS